MNFEMYGELWTDGNFEESLTFDFHDGIVENKSYLVICQLTAEVPPSGFVSIDGSGDAVDTRFLAASSVTQIFIRQIGRDRSTPEHINFDIQTFEGDQNPPAITVAGDRPAWITVVLRSTGGFKKGSVILFSL